MRAWYLLGLLPSALVLAGCGDDVMPVGASGSPLDPATAPQVSVDRFSASAGMLMVRTADNGLPGADEPIDYDSGEPFITQGFGPAGEVVKYYNFDVQRVAPAPIYALFREGESTPVGDQLNIVGKIPGDGGYSDFWRVNKVTVPASYVANTLHSEAAVLSSGYAVEQTDMLVNCPIVPDGSTATLRGGSESSGLHSGWYKDQVVHYFSFEEAALSVSANMVPTSPIYVSFNINPDQSGGGPASGFKTEAGGVQTHNVVATLPGSAAYSPLWSVNPYDNADFDSVSDLSTAAGANVLATGVADVNCPIVSVQ